MTNFQGQASPKAGDPHISPIFICYSPLSFLVIKTSNIIFVKNLHECLLRSNLWRRFDTTAKMSHFQGQTTRASIFFGHPEFRVHFCQKFRQTSVKSLSMESIGHHDQNIPFLRSNEFHSR